MAESMNDNYIEVGKLGKVHGLLGELKLHATETFEQIFFETDHLFIFTANQMVPFFIEAIRSNGGIMKLEGIDTPEEAKGMVGKSIYLQRSEVPEELLAAEPVSEQMLPFEAGFTIRDEQFGNIGEIIEIVELPMQVLASVNYKGREILIPLHEHFIKSVNQDQKVIVVSLPEGILSL